MNPSSKRELTKKFDLHIADSGFNCIINVRGRDKGLRGYGVNAKSKTGPIYEFIKDSVHYYDAVFNHLLICKICSPEAILRAYMTRHVLRREAGVSQTFHTLAMRYKSRFPSVSPDLFNEIQARYESNDLTVVNLGTAKYLHSLPGDELVAIWLVMKIMNS